MGKSRLFAPLFSLGISLLGLAAAQHVTIKYWLWDPNEEVGYKGCVASFEQLHPNITVKITQTGWANYWNNLLTSFVSGTAPDVFWDHVSRFPQLVQSGQLLNLKPYIQQAHLKTNIYTFNNLTKLWDYKGGVYGLPKDFDAIAIFYNKNMFKAAGINPNMANSWTWNPTNGGTFGQVIRKLTVDKNGVRGTSAKFNPSNVKTWGFTPFSGTGPGGNVGQTQWSWLAYSNGWQYSPGSKPGQWVTHFDYNSPKLAQTFQWIVNWQKAGYLSPYSTTTSLGGDSLFLSGKVAMTSDGAWMAGYYYSNAKFPVGVALLPIGPDGRKSMSNDLSDAIWSGSPHKQQAWEWVKYLASPACQNIVARYAVVLPAIKQASQLAVKTFESKGINIRPFYQEAANPKTAFLWPFSKNGNEVYNTAHSDLQKVFLGDVSNIQSYLDQMNKQINSMVQ
jgi:multiple sugar transport system substrate-binding protein